MENLKTFCVVKNIRKTDKGTILEVVTDKNNKVTFSVDKDISYIEEDDLVTIQTNLTNFSTSIKVNDKLKGYFTSLDTFFLFKSKHSDKFNIKEKKFAEELGSNVTAGGNVFASITGAYLGTNYTNYFSSTENGISINGTNCVSNVGSNLTIDYPKGKIVFYNCTFGSLVASPYLMNNTNFPNKEFSAFYLLKDFELMEIMGNGAVNDFLKIPFFDISIDNVNIEKASYIKIVCNPNASSFVGKVKTRTKTTNILYAYIIFNDGSIAEISNKTKYESFDIKKIAVNRIDFIKTMSWSPIKLSSNLEIATSGDVLLNLHSFKVFGSEDIKLDIQGKGIRIDQLGSSSY